MIAWPIMVKRSKSATNQEPDEELPELKAASVTLTVFRGSLEKKELEIAEKTIARLVQRETFAEEFRCLHNKRILPRNRRC